MPLLLQSGFYRDRSICRAKTEHLKTDLINGGEQIIYFCLAVCVWQTLSGGGGQVGGV
jgi:hypothetical protein